jgi:AraC-like DNA-binding protein
MINVIQNVLYFQFMVPALSTNISFKSVEQLDEVTHAMGWATEYRQLEPGTFSSAFTILDGGSWFMMEERSNRTVEVQTPAPEGMYALAMADSGTGAVNGQALDADHLVVMGPDSDTRGTLTPGVKIPQIGIPVDRFESMLRSVAPKLSVPRAGVLSVASTQGRLAGFRRAVRAGLFTPSKRRAGQEEAVSRIVAGLATVLADHGKAPCGNKLHRAEALQALNRAREYIEGHLDQTIRIAGLCRYAGTSLSTLERSFLREMAVTPQQYVRSRRLNAVRGQLLAADREQGQGVTEIALGFGFTHLGRFAGDYHSYFGEYPRETLNPR